MEPATLIGTAVALLALGLVIGAYSWSVRIINRIDRRELTSLREIKRDMRDGGERS